MEAPSRSQRRRQAAIDSGIALVLAMIAYPFPTARALLPVPVFVVSIILLWQLVQIVYCAAAAAVWSTTAGMYLQGLTLHARPDAAHGPRDRITWGALTGAAAVVHIVAPPSRPTLAERVSGMTVSEDGTNTSQK